MVFQGLGAIRGWAQAWLATRSASGGLGLARDAQFPLQVEPAATGLASAACLADCFDLDAALLRLGGDLSLLHRLLRQFALDLAAWEPRLLEHGEQADLPALRQIAHAIKGAAASAGAQSLHCAALALEADLRRDCSPAAVELASACLHELRLALAALRAWQADRQADGGSPCGTPQHAAAGG
jgi:HPt (histidine-containing phosphotransfer) domain-containing protein